jgi:hypothetical protein
LSAGFGPLNRLPLLLRIEQQITALTLKRYATMDEARKRDARQKIQLGGLVVKAGLRDADKAFILGTLIEAAKLISGTPEYERLAKIGREGMK